MLKWKSEASFHLPESKLVVYSKISHYSHKSNAVFDYTISWPLLSQGQDCAAQCACITTALVHLHRIFAGSAV